MSMHAEVLRLSGGGILRYPSQQPSPFPSAPRATRPPPAQAALIVADSGGRVIEAGGELITEQYFDGLAAEVDDQLQVVNPRRCTCCRAGRGLARLQWCLVGRWAVRLGHAHSLNAPHARRSLAL